MSKKMGLMMTGLACEIDIEVHIFLASNVFLE